MGSLDPRLARLVGRKFPIVLLEDSSFSLLSDFLGILALGVLGFTNIFELFLVLVKRLSEGSSKNVVSSARKLSLPTGVLAGPKPVGRLMIGDPPGN